MTENLKEITQKSQNQSFLRKPGFWLFLILFSTWVLLGEALKGADGTTNSQKSKQAEISEEHKVSLAKTFCSERREAYVRSVDLDDFILMYEKAGEEVVLHPEMSKPTDENCRKVIDICLTLWDEDDCQRISEKNIWIGMSEDQVYLAWGLPNDVNNTVTASRVHSQLVYGDFGPYVYLEGATKDDLTVTSWQD